MEFVVHKRHSQPRLGEKGEFHDLGMELGPRSEMQIFSDSHHFVVWVVSDTGSLDSFKSIQFYRKKIPEVVEKVKIRDRDKVNCRFKVIGVRA